MKEWFTAAELAEAKLPGLPSTKRGVNFVADRESWQFRSRQGQGGGFEYHFSALPVTVQLVLAQRATRVDPNIVPLPVKDRSKAVERSTCYSALPEPIQQVCQARAAVVLAYRSFRAANPVLSDRTCRLAFEQAWEVGEIAAEPIVRQLIRGVSPNTVRSWGDTLAAGGLAALAPKYGNRAGSGLIENDAEIKRFLLGILAGRPHAGGQTLMDGLEARFPGRELPSRRSVERFLAGWKRDNAQLLLRLTNPDAWRSKYKAASGNRSEGIVNPNDCWEADSTPADIMLADNHRHKIVGFIDVATRRLRLYVSKESCSAAIASTMRRSLIDWGVPSHLRIDNGSDYTSKHMWRVYDDLDIDVEVCPPFTPEAKPHIERAFRTFSHDLLEFLPGYVGHNVAERKDIEARRSFADRMMDRGETVEIRKTAAELQVFCDQWCDNIYAHRKHSSLGKSPFAAAAAYTGTVSRIENERALDILLSPMSNDGWCTVAKKGIRTGKGRYDAPELGGLEGMRVKALFDEADAGRVFVFGEDGQFICHAVDPDLTGVSRAELAAERKARQARVMKDGLVELKKMAKEARVEDLVADILMDKAEKVGKLVRLPTPVERFTTPALDAAADAAVAHQPPKSQLSPEMAASVARIRSEMAAELASAPPQSPKDRYRRALAVQTAIDAGQPIDDNEVHWFNGYRMTAEYRTQADLHLEFGDLYLGRAVSA